MTGVNLDLLMIMIAVIALSPLLLCVQNVL